jgi:hypothetical protein
MKINSELREHIFNIIDSQIKNSDPPATASVGLWAGSDGN